jgi:hypothetical protein
VPFENLDIPVCDEPPKDVLRALLRQSAIVRNRSDRWKGDAGVPIDPIGDAQQN